MKTILLGLGAVSLAAAAAPAAAQYRTAPDYQAPQSYGGYDRPREPYSDYGYGTPGHGGDRISRLLARVERGYAGGSISRGEAQNLRNQLRQYGRLERQYARNGLSDWERRDLAQRLRRFHGDLRIAEGTGYGYRDRYGDDRYGDDRYDGRGYQGRDYDDDRWDDDGRYDDDDGYREPLGL